MKRPSVTATLAAISISVAANASTIPLKAGDYGDSTLPCNNQPNAGIISFDGKNFQYPHATRCSDTIRSKAAGVLSITETCRANGDGSPATPSTQTFKIKPAGLERFHLMQANHSAAYRRCGALGFFNKH